MTQETRHFAEALGELKQRLLMMGRLAEQRVSAAIEALVARDFQLIGRVIDGDSALNTLQIEIDDRAFKLLALHQPMARLSLTWEAGAVLRPAYPTAAEVAQRAFE